MKHPRSYQRRSASGNRSDYEQLFIRRVHDLIKWGYDRLCASAYATQEETVITGDLAEAIEDILEYQNERWMQFFLVISPTYTFLLLNGDIEFYRNRHLFI